MIGGFPSALRKTGPFVTLVIPARRANIAIEAGFVYPACYPRPASDTPEMTKKAGFYWFGEVAEWLKAAVC
jgi:hypothetical protein